jgi:TPR repeat protein
MHPVHRVLSAALICAVSLAARADYDGGAEALRRGDHAQALRMLVAAADGDARAAALLADMHERGLGTPRDPEHAFRWRRLAAEQGHLPSALRLGQMFLRGDGAPRSDEAAKQWMRKAAEGGMSEAQLELSKLLGAANASDADARESRLWYERAMANGAVTSPVVPPPEAAATPAASPGPTLTDLRAQRAQRDAWRARAWAGAGPRWGGVHGWYDPYWTPWAWGPSVPGGVTTWWGWSAPVAPGVRFGVTQGYRW